MDIGTLGGMVTMFIFILWAMASLVGLAKVFIVYLDIPSVILVLGCTFMGYIISTPLSKLKLIILVGKAAFREKKVDLTSIIPVLVGFAEKARREGLLALEDDVESLEDDFLKRGVQLVVDGTDPDLVKNIMQTQMDYIEERHSFGKAIFENMATLAPAFGMIGTLCGLVAMLLSMDDPNSIGPYMATALITTLYGAILANGMFNPMAYKLAAKSSDEILLKKLMLEGMLAIQAGDNPRIVEQKLKAYLPPNIAAQLKNADEGGE